MVEALLLVVVLVLVPSQVVVVVLVPSQVVVVVLVPSQVVVVAQVVGLVLGLSKRGNRIKPILNRLAFFLN